MTTESTTTESEKKLRGRKKRAAPENGADTENGAENFSKDKNAAPKKSLLSDDKATPPPKKGPGAPSTYTKEIAEEICWRLAQGQTLKSICMLNHMPNITTVFDWEARHGEFAQMSARAREHGTHVLADQCIEIADDPLMDPADKRVRIDTRIRLIGKWNAKRYGDKIEHEVKTDFIPLDELRRRIEESKARRASLELEENKLLGTGEGS
jgi:hypothetical protein